MYINLLYDNLIYIRLEFIDFLRKEDMRQVSTPTKITYEMIACIIINLIIIHSSININLYNNYKSILSIT